MLIKITFQLIILIFSTVILRAQYFESVEKEAERILISLSDGDSLNPSDFNALKNILSSEIDDKVTKSYPDINPRSIDSLKTHLDEFESEAQNISTDSAFVLFNDWYSALSKYLLRLFKAKILLIKQNKNSFLQHINVLPLHT